ncbi:aldo/keto reductase [Gudongella oleilytica]|uniref:aldo/keto reductase n=1 Tax=Gudongella oleilytica TaxID=1582259 RepID=UPI000FF8B08D|nr:aldo/keto reductase [Gudongella oleilytica]
MQYREITSEKLNVSLLGYGCMRFPVVGGDNSRIDFEESEKLLKYAIENGVNYIDTAYPYHGGKSEDFVGQVLSLGLRERVYLATKSPVWLVKKYDDFIKYLDEQLVNLRTNYFDFYLLHSLDAESWKKIVELEVFDFIHEAKSSGKIKNIGFSFHDDLKVFKEIIDSYDWDFCQIQLNYMDTGYQAGLEGLMYAKNKGIDVVVMEPLKGGKLANIPQKSKEAIESKASERTAAELALKWLQQLDGVKVVLSGMSSMEQVEENIKIYSDNTPLSESELEAVDYLKSFFESRIAVGCTGCEYCQPCKAGVRIPGIFELYNNLTVYETVDQSKSSYKGYVEKGASSLSCVECGECEAICPQQLSIISQLKDAHKALI